MVVMPRREEQVSQQKQHIRQYRGDKKYQQQKNQAEMPTNGLFSVYKYGNWQSKAKKHRVEAWQ